MVSKRVEAAIDNLLATTAISSAATPTNSESSVASSSPEHNLGGHTMSLPPHPASSWTIQMVAIRSHVPITLDLSESNYNQWRTFFNTVFRKFALGSHINTPSAQAPIDVEWVMIDFAIVNWLYTTVSKEILELVMKPGSIAYDVWHTIEGLFRDNRLTRAVYIEAEFCSLYQGDLTIMQYCFKLKHCTMSASQCVRRTNS
ncbi:uncharacterized protein LOC133930077 [Phragmites australis]|uniref:uncharacterized protein LOC133930077 n=1 Tax=Phragmites australis TaxID=29695 RepID=UPI002D780084|nr:uncharacterized protein LOC133930077 [Phragmites australis]